MISRGASRVGGANGSSNTLHILDVWLVKLGTNLKQCEILALEASGFQLPQNVLISPGRLFSIAPSSSNLNSVVPTLNLTHT